MIIGREITSTLLCKRISIDCGHEEIIFNATNLIDVKIDVKFIYSNDKCLPHMLSREICMKSTSEKLLNSIPFFFFFDSGKTIFHAHFSFIFAINYAEKGLY